MWSTPEMNLGVGFGGTEGELKSCISLPACPPPPTKWLPIDKLFINRKLITNHKHGYEHTKCSTSNNRGKQTELCFTVKCSESSRATQPGSQPQQQQHTEESDALQRQAGGQ